MKKGIGLLGCRVRPFMENAFRHGYDVRAADGFNDWDAQKFGKLVTADTVNPACYPDVLKRYRDLDGCPTVFCGPVEADPSLIEQASKEVRVLNAPASAIAKSRNHDFLKQMATDGVVLPKTGLDYAPAAGTSGTMTRNLIKEITSAGGVGVMEDVGAKLRAGQYRQQAVDGLSVGATFLTVKNGLPVKKGGSFLTGLMGITEHINRVTEFGQSGYLYGGLIYPADVKSIHAQAIKNFGERAAAVSGLTGWWGADFILNENGAYLLEINPRFPASAELIALAHDIDLVGTQTSAIEGDTVDVDVGEPRSYTATAVCYAKADCVFNSPKKWFDQGARDIPHEGKEIKRGGPIISLYANSESSEECKRALKKLAAKLYTELNSAISK